MSDQTADQVFTLTFWFEPSRLSGEAWRGKVLHGSAAAEPKLVTNPEEAFDLIRRALQAASVDWAEANNASPAVRHRSGVKFFCSHLDRLMWRIGNWRRW